MNDSSSRPSDLTRRNLIAASAWSVPIVAVAVSAPSAAAASGDAAGCGVDYQLSLLNPSIGLITNISSAVQLVTLVLTSTNDVNAIILVDQATNESTSLASPTASGLINNLPVSWTASSSTGGTIAVTLPVGATYLVFPDVSFPPLSGTGSLTAVGGSCSPLPLVFTSG